MIDRQNAIDVAFSDARGSEQSGTPQPPARRLRVNRHVAIMGGVFGGSYLLMSAMLAGVDGIAALGDGNTQAALAGLAAVFAALVWQPE